MGSSAARAIGGPAFEEIVLDRFGRIDRVLEQLVDDPRVARLEPWRSKVWLAEHLSCSERKVDTWIAEGMPYAIIAGRAKFRVSEVEPWLELHGHMERRNG